MEVRRAFEYTLDRVGTDVGAPPVVDIARLRSQERKGLYSRLALGMPKTVRNREERSHCALAKFCGLACCPQAASGVWRVCAFSTSCSFTLL